MIPSFGGEFFEAAAGVESELSEIEATLDFVNNTEKEGGGVFINHICQLGHLVNFIHPPNISSHSFGTNGTQPPKCENVSSPK